MSLQAHPKNVDELNNGMNYDLSIYSSSWEWLEITELNNGLFTAGQFYGFHGSRSSQFHSTDKVNHYVVYSIWDFTCSLGESRLLWWLPTGFSS